MGYPRAVARDFMDSTRQAPSIVDVQSGPKQLFMRTGRGSGISATLSLTYPRTATGNTFSTDDKTANGSKGYNMPSRRTRGRATRRPSHKGWRCTTTQATAIAVGIERGTSYLATQALFKFTGQKYYSIEALLSSFEFCANGMLIDLMRASFPNFEFCAWDW